jgi:glycosyltransferase involved in cell wall biosynthesis
VEGLHGATAIPDLLRTLNRLRPAVFHAHLTSLQWCKFALAAAICARVPAVVATVHAFPEMTMTRPAVLQRELVAARVDRFVVTSNHAASRLHTTLRATRNRTTLVPNGVDLGRFGVAADPALRRLLTADGRRKAAVVPARLYRDKGQAVLLEAAKDLPDLQVVLAGAGPDEERLRLLAAELDIVDRVSFLGFRQDVPNLLAAADMLVLPTLNEAFGIAIVEAMAASRPVVATRVGGPEDIIGAGTGLLVPPSDPAALRVALRRLMDEPGLARQLAANGRSRVEDHFSLDMVTARLSDVYARILADGRPTRWRGRTATPTA